MAWIGWAGSAAKYTQVNIFCNKYNISEEVKYAVVLSGKFVLVTAVTAALIITTEKRITSSFKHIPYFYFTWAQNLAM